MNTRTIAQSLQTAIEGTRAESVLANLSQDRKDQMMQALAGMDDSTRDGYFSKFMGMTEATASSIIDGVIAAAPSASGSSYTVQKGDSLSKIAKAHSISLNAIIKANPQIENVDLIYPNQKINLPRD